MASLLIGALGASDASAQISKVSVAFDGTDANGDSTAVSISDDGRFVAFQSAASNLVPNDTNDSVDVFVRDRQTNTTTRVSVTSADEERPGMSFDPRLTPDGRFVVFASLAPLVAEDALTCELDFPSRCLDVYIHDRNTATTTRVSVSSTGDAGADGSGGGRASADGRYVVFSSPAGNLVANDTNNTLDVFLRDRQAGTTTRLSVRADGSEDASGGHSPLISDDGRFVVYSTDAAPSEVNEPATCLTARCSVLMLRERETGTLTRLSNLLPPVNTRAPGLPALEGIRYETQAVVGLSADGRFILITQHAQHTLHPKFPWRRDLLHDRLTGQTTVIGDWGAVSSTSVQNYRDLSADGRTSVATGGAEIITLADRLTGLRQSLSNTVPIPETRYAALSGDARFTAFTTFQPLVGPPPPVGFRFDVYVFDRDTDADGLPSGWETAFRLDPANADAAADPDGDGLTNLQEYRRASHPTATHTRYFAEGAANAFFSTRLAFVNPGDTGATVVCRFLGQNGETSSRMFTLGSRTRLTLELGAASAVPGNDFSTVIESDQPIVADRTMTWDASGHGAHTETSLAAPSTTWHLAEGATHGAFDLFYLLQNPNQVDATVDINYLRLAPLTPIAKSYVVPANSRRTIWVDDEGTGLEAVDVAAAITSSVPIVAERAMYSTRAGQPSFAAGHGGAGVTAPALKWFLAEGATGVFFDLYVLVSNPGATASNITVTYLRPAGEPFSKTYTVGARNRLTISVQGEDARLADTPVSVIVESTNNQPVVAERAMWWPKGEWYEAHLSAGATTTGTRWALAEGEVTATSDTYILIANTSATAGTATLLLLEEGVPPSPISIDLPASSRVNVRVSELLPVSGTQPRRRFGAIVESSGVEIVVERAMYSSAGGVIWSAGTAALGTKLP